MVPTNEFKKGVKLLIDNAPWVIVDAQFVKPGKGSAFTRTKFKNLIDGRTFEENVRSGNSYPRADTDEQQMQYLYKDGDNYVFMNNTNYEQVMITEAALGDDANYLVENLEAKVMFFEGRAISIELPNFVELEITYCEPGIKGDTATGSTKPATLSTGAIVNVPLFVEQGEWIKVDTRTNSYSERVKR